MRHLPLAVDMEDEDGTCLLDVLCDPQALNDFLHGTAELHSEDLLISASSGETSLFADAPSPVSLLGDDGGSPSTPPSGCVDLSFLEEALLSSPEGADDLGQVEEPQGEPPVEPLVEPPVEAPVEPGCQSKEEVAAKEEEEVACCDILQQSLKEADITEQTVAQTGDSLYPPVLTPPAVPFVAKPGVMALPRDTQAAVEPPQPSLLAVGPGCPSLKPAPPPQLMGLLPGNVFPAPSPETSLVQGSGMILHKAVNSRPLVAPAPGIVLQRARHPIQPKLPISIQPRLVQISPKPLGQTPAPGLTLVSGTASPNILLSQKPSTPAPEPLPKPVSLQLLNQGGSFMLQPQGLFQGKNQFLLPGQPQVTITQPTAGPLLTAAPPGPQVSPFNGQLVDGSQILTMPQRQLNFSPVFTTTRQIALGQAAIFSPTVFQMPAQLAGSYVNGGQGQRAALVHGPGLGNHITLINGSGMLPSDLAAISIVNTPSMVQGLPFAAQPAQAAVTDAHLGLQTASVVLLPERGIPEERNGSEESFHQQRLGQVIQQQVSVQPVAPSPPVPTVLPPPPESPTIPDVAQVVEDVAQSLSRNQVLMQQLKQQALDSPETSDLLVGVAPAVPMDSLTPPVDNEQQSQPETTMLDPCADVSPLPSDSEGTLGSPPSLQDSATFSDPTPLPGLEGSEALFIHDGGLLSSPCQVLPSEPSLAPGLPVPQQQPEPSAGERVDTPVQQHTQNTPTAALVVESDVPTPDIRSPSPSTREHHLPPEDAQQLAGVELQSEESLTPATRQHRFQQLLCSDHLAVQLPCTGPAFCSLTDAFRRLLPYHVCAGHPPSQEDLALVDQEFDTVSGFLLKRTKDMVNKYRQLLVKETWESPSAEMVMLERLFLQAERFSLGEDRRRAHRDPEAFLMSLTSSASSSHSPGTSQPPPPSQAPTWTRLSERPPGLKTYRSSSRGALRLTIKQECGSRKVVHSSIGESGLKRDHVGRLSNGGVARHSRRDDKIPNGAESKKRKLLSAPTPRVKCLRLDAPPPPLSPPLREDSVLNEHLQSAIDSILELQRLQGPPAGPLNMASDQPVTSASTCEAPRGHWNSQLSQPKA
ncbi:BRD4-interacting chromatin-remodeling complex-associated protein isoform X2 [Syngnathus scovelli]|uniref:BRD4-interacting chromatin-remodeling complex-associated protein isoform X2 n=1 Tax=Syngnathus scovelli TaxID=161590 RepID=UPI00210FE03E|nr:BRD4-interacting chromatin-remodeling complex-associated protein isoform X2 [Syngnathus scovelli]